MSYLSEKKDEPQKQIERRKDLLKQLKGLEDSTTELLKKMKDLKDQYTKKSSEFVLAYLVAHTLFELV